VVLVTDGYSSPQAASQNEPTYLLHANQLRVEHRFFGQSMPASQDWSKLTIAQAAADHHAVVAAFKKVYPAHWIATGGSKSGMTAVYFRYFYPGDVDGTVAYSAPSSHGIDDTRYTDFLAQVGTEDCRDRLRVLESEALARRKDLQALMTEGSYEYLGKDRALEFAIIETPFAFWQTQEESRCATIPGAGASDKDILSFIIEVTGFAYDDDNLDILAPYFYQTAVELGWPRPDEEWLKPLLRYPREDVPATYPPYGVKKVFDPAAMPAIERWVSFEGEHLLFMYGERDPWSSTAFEVRPDNDAYRFYVHGLGGNHKAKILNLPDAERNTAMLALRRWAGLPWVADPFEALGPVLVEEPQAAELLRP
jgi:hypothetical protein